MPRFVPPLTQSPTQPLTPLALALTLIFTPALATPAHAQSTPTPEEPGILQPVTVSAEGHGGQAPARRINRWPAFSDALKAVHS